MGSSIEVKKAPVDNNARVIETLDTLIAPKNVSQWSAIIIPAIIRRNILFGATFKFLFFHQIQKNIKPLARSMRYQTRGIASRVMSAPRTAVNPQIKTIK